MMTNFLVCTKVTLYPWSERKTLSTLMLFSRQENQPNWWQTSALYLLRLKFIITLSSKKRCPEATNFPCAHSPQRRVSLIPLPSGTLCGPWPALRQHLHRWSPDGGSCLLFLWGTCVQDWECPVKWRAVSTNVRGVSQGKFRSFKDSGGSFQVRHKIRSWKKETAKRSKACKERSNAELLHHTETARLPPSSHAASAFCGPMFLLLSSLSEMFPVCLLVLLHYYNLQFCQEIPITYWVPGKKSGTDDAREA